MFTKGGDKTLGHNNSKNSNKRQTKRAQVRYSCTKDTLKAIKDLHPLPAVILEHRKLTALITKYIDVLPKYIRYNNALEMDRYATILCSRRLVTYVLSDCMVLGCKLPRLRVASLSKIRTCKLFPTR